LMILRRIEDRISTIYTGTILTIISNRWELV
jgi:hypothetical protein